MRLQFRKMHGIGNDFVFVIENDESSFKKIQNASRYICDRNFGVGADGVIVLSPSEVADIKMTIFNSDGSIAKMCGNAIRCVGRIMAEKSNSNDPITVETLGGIKTVSIVERNDNDWQIKVNMGQPELSANKVGVISKGEKVIDVPFDIEGTKMNFTCVSMGNPHAVTFVDKIDKDKYMKLGPIVENDPSFPDRTNVEFVEVKDDCLKVFVWERGAGPTLACGTGACAVTVAAVLNGKSERSSYVELPGGKLFIEWNEDNNLYMTGSATHVFDGTIDI